MKNIRLHHALVPAIVFITGACVLIIEVLATRILSPYFGNTIYAVSSVIGIVLGALSVGYYLGGRIADRKGSDALFFGIIGASGLSVFFLGGLVETILPQNALSFSIISGPLIFSLLLFLIPNIFLGMLSPFAIALQKNHAHGEGVGRVSGEIFFWSTLGSIAGSLLAGFVLIPRYGIVDIIIGLAVVLLVMGALGVGWKVPYPKKIIIACVCAFVIFGAGFLLYSGDAGRSAAYLYHHDGIYEQVAIFDGTHDGKPARFLKQDRSNSAAMYRDSEGLVFDYTKYYALVSLMKKDVRSTLVLGAGAYSVPKALLHDFPTATVDVVDIEPELFDLGKKFFRVPDDPRLHNEISDGRRFLHAHPGQYDLIFNDAFSSLYSVPVHMTTKEFFQSARYSLSDNGVFVGNVIGSLSRTSPSMILSEMKTFREVFPNSYFFAVSSPSSIDPQNIIFFGIKGDTPLDFTSNDLTSSPYEIIRTLAQKNIDPARFNLDAYSLFTDMHAPVEYAISKIFGKRFVGSSFSGDQALALVSEQLSYGPRSIRASGHAVMQEFLLAESHALSTKVFTQEWNHINEDGSTMPLKNIGFSLFPEQKKRILLVTHYDIQPTAFKDLEHPNASVPGANNGASGVATLLELARAISQSDHAPKVGIDIVFFDGEEGEQGVESLTAWQPIGSQYFRDHMKDIYPESKPFAAIDIDMVCKDGLTLKKEPTSVAKAPWLVDDVWRIGKQVAPDVFSDGSSVGILDDHTSLNAAGIPSIVLIDFDYLWNYTTHDTLDKCSKKSLQGVGDTLLGYIRSL